MSEPLAKSETSSIEARLNQVEVNIGRLAENANRTQDDIRNLAKESAELAKDFREFMSRPTDTTQLTRWLALVITILLAGIGAMTYPWATSVQKNAAQLASLDNTVVSERVRNAERLTALERDAYWLRQVKQDAHDVTDKHIARLDSLIEKARDAEVKAQQEEEHALRSREAAQAAAAYESFTARMQDMETRSENRDREIRDRMDLYHKGGKPN